MLRLQFHFQCFGRLGIFSSWSEDFGDHVINQKALSQIREFEALRLEAYQCSAKKWTIGYGHTKGVKEGDTCTEEEAEAWLFEDCQDVIKGLQSIKFNVDLNENQWAALISLIFNIGITHFNTSTVKKELLKKKWSPVLLSRAWKMWNKETVDGKKVVSNGLVRRRKKEVTLFFQPLEYV